MSSLSVDGSRTRRSILDEEPFVPEPREPPLAKPELTSAIQLQANNVTKTFQRRKELDEPVAPPSAPPVKHVAGFDASKIRIDGDAAWIGAKWNPQGKASFIRDLTVSSHGTIRIYAEEGAGRSKDGAQPSTSAQWSYEYVSQEAVLAACGSRPGVIPLPSGSDAK